MFTPYATIDYMMMSNKTRPWPSFLGAAATYTAYNIVRVKTFFVLNVDVKIFKTFVLAETTF